MNVIENMAGLAFNSPSLLLAAFLLVSDCSTIQAQPQRPGAAGVFLLIENGKYTFNFTSARDACLSLNASIATRAQMEQALQRGLQTCKFGWIAEGIAVIPRLSPDPNCGKNSTGVVLWHVKHHKAFAVYCFNASALDYTTRSAISPQISTSSTGLLTPPHTSTAATSASKQTPRPPASVQPGTTRLTETWSKAETTHAARIPSISTASARRNPPTRRPTSPPPVIPSEPTVNHVSPTSERVSTFSSTPSAGADQHSLGDVPTALIIVGIILFLLTAAAIVLYYKLNIFAFWPQGQQKDDIETEMWKQTDSEMEHSQRGGGEEEGEEEEEEEEYRKYSSDITLCVKPDMRTESFE